MIPKSRLYGRHKAHSHGYKTVIINGRRMTLDGSVTGRKLILASHLGPGRRAVIRNGLEVQTIDPQKIYGPKDLEDKYGRPVHISSMPDRSKGSILYGAPRSELSKAVITDQVYDIAANCFKSGVDFDEINADWLVIPQYRLPRLWNHAVTPLLIVFPTDYPEIPPVGFYLKKDLGVSPNGHFYSKAYHDACKTPLDKGWKWYCCYYKPGSWRPAAIRRLGDWRKGDNLWTHLIMIGEVLGNLGD